VVVFYVSGHGFGHASRSLEVIRALSAGRPDVGLAVRTTAAKWLFDLAGIPGLAYEACETDVGMTQADSLTMDLEDTARRAAAFYRDFDRRADEEAAGLRARGARLVAGDIPPLAHAAAARAGLRSIAIGNFTWDWIYESYAAFAREAPGAVDVIRGGYRQATRALRLPMHGGFAAFGAVVDVPMIARHATRSRDETRRLLAIPGDRPCVLASFGGYGVDLACEAIARREGLTILSPGASLPPPLRYPDLVAAADAVISKPGYGIVSECAANGTPLLYTSRGPFPEYDVFVAEMPRVLRCRFMPQDDLRAGRWRPHVDALLAQSPPPERAATDGAGIAAEHILRLLD
jgi:UDP:flavonoid glycosyltransferase YjiC (YdhE family)